MGQWIKRAAKALGAIVALGALGIGVFAWRQTSAYDASMEKVYDIAPLAITHSTDPAVIARGEHLAKWVAGCSNRDCHGADLGGGRTIEMGPVGTIVGPNITNIVPAYTDGELGRLIRHGIKRDGRSLAFMPVQDFDWLPDSDVVAIVSYLRITPPVERPNAGATKFRTLGKILDRRGQFVADVARHIDHTNIELAPPPSPTKDYGRFVARLCTGCHGEHLSGGRIPGAPPNFAIPRNITFDATGLADWSYDDFVHMSETATRKNGQPLDKLMPVEALRNMDDTERHAIFAYLQSIPPLPFGSR